ncbi:hypothetical protein GOV12_02630 [Candidatus Pacearchaeota archaeon]|nr:hypothetical protein [Candidatus Pacearchaeota archaeon]
MTKDLTIVYMAAGMSSRFHGDIKAFANLGPNDESLIEFSLNQAISAGFNKIIFIVGVDTIKPFQEKFNDSYKNLPIKYVMQNFDKDKRDRPWGTTDAACTIKDVIDTPFVICNSDDIYGNKNFQTLANHLKESDDDATIGYVLIDHLSNSAPGNRAIFKTKDDYVQDLTEVLGIEKNNLKKTNTFANDLCSMSIFALHPNTVKHMDDILQTFKNNNKNNRKIEALLPNTISQLIKENKIKMKIYPCKQNAIGVTVPSDVEIVKKRLKDEAN